MAAGIMNQVQVTTQIAIFKQELQLIFCFIRSANPLKCRVTLSGTVAAIINQVCYTSYTNILKYTLL